MPTTATVTSQPPTAGKEQTTKNKVTSNVIPFVRASAEHREAAYDATRPMTISDQDLGVIDIPAYGYLRSIYVFVEATGASTATGLTLTEDGIFNALGNITLSEPNGAVLCQFNNGYELYLANKYGGYRPYSDMRFAPSFTDAAANNANFKFALRIPIELNARDGLGAIANQNSGAQYKLKLTLSGSEKVYASNAPATLPNVRIRTFIECWDQPVPSIGGAMNQTTPPALNTTQFWTSQIFSISSGANTVKLSRVGNYIRNMIFIYRAGTRAAGETNMPDPATLMLDARPFNLIGKSINRDLIFERTGFNATQDAGVLVESYTHDFDGKLGYENGDLWLPTLPSTRLELQGSFGAAGTLTVLTNDIAVAGNVW